MAGVLCEYAGEMVTAVGVLSAAAMLGNDVQFNVVELINGVLSAAKGRQDLEQEPVIEMSGTFITSVCQGVLHKLGLARLPLRLLFHNLAAKRAVEIGVPLLLLLSRSNRPEAMDLGLEILNSLWKASFHKRHFCEELEIISEDRGTLVDHVLLRALGIHVPELLDGSQYERLFSEMQSTASVDVRTKQYAERTLRAIEGERQRRAVAFKRASSRR